MALRHRFAHWPARRCGGGKKICYLRGKRGKKAAQRSAAGELRSLISLQPLAVGAHAHQLQPTEQAHRGVGIGELRVHHSGLDAAILHLGPAVQLAIRHDQDAEDGHL